VAGSDRSKRRRDTTRRAAGKLLRDKLDSSHRQVVRPEEDGRAVPEIALGGRAWTAALLALMAFSLWLAAAASASAFTVQGSVEQIDGQANQRRRNLGVATFQYLTMLTILVLLRTVHKLRVRPRNEAGSLELDSRRSAAPPVYGQYVTIIPLKPIARGPMSRS
jgi:hypothetical protein